MVWENCKDAKEPMFRVTIHPAFWEKGWKEHVQFVLIKVSLNVRVRNHPYWLSVGAPGFLGWEGALSARVLFILLAF